MFRREVIIPWNSVWCGYDMRMAAERFPLSVSETLGQFVIAPLGGEHKSRERTGMVRVGDKRVELEVSPELTPSIEWESRPDGSWVGISPAAEPADFVVHGTLATAPGAITLWGVRTVHRQSLGWAAPGMDTPGRQMMDADWCLVGDHLPDPSATFGEVRIDVSNLHDWGGISGVRHTFPLDGKGERAWILDSPDSVVAPLNQVDGEIALSPSATMSPPSKDGFRVTTNTLAIATRSSGWTLQEALFLVAQPIANLMTILSGSRSEVRALSVHRDGRAIDVYGSGISGSAPAGGGDLLVFRHDVGIDLLPGWLELDYRVAPVPEILAAAYSDEFTTIDTEALSLAAAAETLHRLLHPGEKRFSAGDLNIAVDAVKASEMPDGVKDSLVNALNTWWGDKSYPQRIRDLARPVAEVIPQCFGKLSRWVTQIVSQRVSLAHGLAGAEPRESADILRMHSLTRSLRWMLTLRLLLEAGVKPEVLSNAVSRSERFSRDRRIWQQEWPDIYQV